MSRRKKNAALVSCVNDSRIITNDFLRRTLYESYRPMGYQIYGKLQEKALHTMLDRCLDRLLPGADDGNGNRLTIESVNDGRDYLENATGIALFGHIWETLTWEDVTIASNLKTKGRAALDAAVLRSFTITVSAVDLAALGVNTDAIRTGWSYRVISEPHGIDMYMAVVRSEIDPQNVSENTYTFGAVIQALTDRQAGTAKTSAAGVETQVKNAEGKIAETSEKLENLILRVNDIGGKYAEQQDLEDFLDSYDKKIEEFETRISNLEGGGE